MNPFAAATLVACLFHLDPRIDVLIQQQGHANFRVREAATRQLHALGQRAMPLLQRHQDSPDREVAARCRKLVAAYQSWREHPLPDGCSKLPWIDSLCPAMHKFTAGRRQMRLLGPAGNFLPEAEESWPRATVRYYGDLAWAERSEDEHYEESDDWKNDRRATGLYVRDLIRAGVARQAVVELLNDMEVTDMAWRAGYARFKLQRVAPVENFR